MAVIGTVGTSIFILLFSAISSVIPAGLSSLEIPVPHGFSEILYAFTQPLRTTAVGFAGLNGDTNYWNIYARH